MGNNKNTMTYEDITGESKDSDLDSNEEKYQAWRQAREAWLDSHHEGLTEGDVMEDEEGEYVNLEWEDGFKKKHLPEELQKNI